MIAGESADHWRTWETSRESNRIIVQQIRFTERAWRFSGTWSISEGWRDFWNRLHAPRRHNRNRSARCVWQVRPQRYGKVLVRRLCPQNKLSWNRVSRRLGEPCPSQSAEMRGWRVG